MEKEEGFVDPGRKEKKAWVPMKLVLVGNAMDLIKGGGGKLSAAGGDPGEGKKQPSG